MKIVMLRLLPLLAIVAMPVGFQQVTAVPKDDPCDPSNHTVLDEPFRSTGFIISSPHQMPLCDIRLEMGWYRFNSSTGGTMADSCPGKYHCGTIAPIWMNGVLPTAAEGVVTRQICAHYNNNCCELKSTVKVKRCADFYIYYLYPTPSCPFSYCAGNEMPCPFGKWSPTMLPPCKDAFPMLTTIPKLTGPNIINDKTFNFQCEVIYHDENPGQVFEIIWTFDGQEDPKIPVHKLTDPDRNVTMEGYYLKGHLNKYLECKVRSYYVGNEANKSPYMTSNSYYSGIEVSPNQLTASEEDFEHNINVTSTVPIVCDFNTRCCLNLQLDVDVHKDLVIWNGCTYDLCADAWDNDTNSATVEIKVMAKQDMVNDEDKTLELTFEPINQLLGGPYLQLFNGYRPDQVTIQTMNADTATCTVGGDPHFTSFDGGKYDLFKLGVFTVAEVASMDFQVQIMTWRCNFASDIPVTCICGIVIREGNDVLRLNQCDQPFGGPLTSPKLERARDLGTGTTVQRSGNGRNFGVYLPSGSRIKIDAYTTDITLVITLAGVYHGKARGLCGTNDGNRDNEFTYPDNVVKPYWHGVVLDKFADAWEANPTTNLFEVLPAEKPVTNVTQYCQCGKTNNSPVVDCTIRPSDPTQIICNGCSTLRNDEIPENPRWTNKRKREELYEDIDEPDQPNVQQDVPPADPNKQWPNSQGVTKAQATEMCTKALAKSQLSSKSGEMQDLYDSSMMDCLSDILYGETTQFLDSITATFTAQTQVALSKNPDNYVTNIEGKVIMKPEYLDDICDLSCDEHGECKPGGVCDCDEGWESTNCHIESGKGPQMAQIRSGPLCDKSQRPCKKVFTDISNVDLTEHLLCRVQMIDEQGNHQGLPADTNATSLSAFRIACGLPETSTSSQHYKISASNDGSLFGNEKHLHVYDSICMDCDETSCTVKTTACHINKVCYKDGTKKDDDPYKICDITKDTTDWTLLPKPTTTPPTPPTTTSTTTTVRVTTSTTPTPVKTEPTTTVGNIYGNEVDASDVCLQKQLSTGIHPHPYDCTKFVQCTGTHTDVMNCQEGLTYDPSIQSCNYRYLNKSCQR